MAAAGQDGPNPLISAPDHRRGEASLVVGEETWRNANASELAVLRRLLSQGSFPGQNELLKQLTGIVVRTIDAEGSLELKATGDPAVTRGRVPVSGRYFDGETQEGPAVNLLVHVVDGMLSELEIYKDDGTLIRESPFEIDLDLIKDF